MDPNLYTTHASEFSKTRTAPWKGWSKLIEDQLFPKSNLRVLDLGCGNGRFLKFVQQYFEVELYLGVDNSEVLIQEAKGVGGEYLNLDIDNSNWEIPEKEFNLIVAFGVQHHLSNQSHRQYLLTNISNLLSQKGIAAVSYWQFLDYPRYQNKIQQLQSENNFSMNFGSNKNARFCHFTNLEEIEELEKDSGLKLHSTFRSDGRDNTENIYRIYSKA